MICQISISFKTNALVIELAQVRLYWKTPESGATSPFIAFIQFISRSEIKLAIGSYIFLSTNIFGSEKSAIYTFVTDRAVLRPLDELNLCNRSLAPFLALILNYIPVLRTTAGIHDNSEDKPDHVDRENDYTFDKHIATRVSTPFLCFFCHLFNFSNVY